MVLEEVPALLAEQVLAEAPEPLARELSEPEQPEVPVSAEEQVSEPLALELSELERLEVLALVEAQVLAEESELPVRELLAPRLLMPFPQQDPTAVPELPEVPELLAELVVPAALVEVLAAPAVQERLAVLAEVPELPAASEVVLAALAVQERLAVSEEVLELLAV